MRVYVGACPGKNLNYFNHLYPRQIGIIHTPTKRMSFNPNYPLVLDNGAFTVAPGAEFPIEKFWKFLTRYRQSNATAEWIVVPDAVGDKATTISYWHRWSQRVKDYGRVAFVVQDEMTKKDVPPEAEVVFFG
jgi:hypothetical protein